MKNVSKTVKGIAEAIATNTETHFLELAKELRWLQEVQPHVFVKVAKMAGLSRRKAYALARISRQIEGLGIKEERLRAIGWTKLQIIGRYLTKENAEYLLGLSEQDTVYELEARLRGETPVEDARVMMLYLSPADYERLKVELIAFGAIPSGGGLLRKEAALMALVHAHLSDSIQTEGVSAEDQKNEGRS